MIMASLEEQEFHFIPSVAMTALARLICPEKVYRLLHVRLPGNRSGTFSRGINFRRW
jgi:hypothetical protein